MSDILARIDSLTADADTAAPATSHHYGAATGGIRYSASTTPLGALATAGAPARGTSVFDVLHHAGLDYTVEKTPAYHATPSGYAPAPDRFLIRRTDTLEVLGAAGAEYQVHQNRDVFSVVDALAAEDLARPDLAGEYSGKPFVALSLGTRAVLAETDHADPMTVHVVINGDHSGAGSTRAFLSANRIACGNQLGSAAHSAFARISLQHSGDTRSKLARMRRFLTLQLSEFDRWVEQTNILATTSVSRAEVNAIVSELFPAPASTASKRTLTNHETRLELLRQAWADPSNDGIRGTAYHVENMVTFYADHLKGTRANNSLAEDIRRSHRALAEVQPEKAAARRLLVARYVS